MSGVNRRAFLASVAATGGALTLGFALRADAGDGTLKTAREINAWIVIEPDDTVIIRVARTEMGQGILTALPMLVAEELACDWTKVRPEYVAGQENARRRRVWGDMSTGGSRSVRASQLALRQAGATAREMLVAAAAARWMVLPSECSAANGVVTHAPSGRAARFGALADDAAKQAPPTAVRLKKPAQWTLIGTPQRQINCLPKINGQAVYGIDVRVPGMLHAAIVHCPQFGGTVGTVDAARAMGMPGVHRVVTLDDAVAVVADHWWQAQRAVQALPVTWVSEPHAAGTSSADIAAFVREGLDADDAELGREEGDAATALDTASRKVTADYAVPFLAHATLEPQNCTAHVTRDLVEVWAPTQNAEMALATAATAAGVSSDKVVVHRTMLGGGFGRRGAVHDFVREAVVIAKHVDRPVKLIWSREEDIRHDFYRPIAMARLSAALDAQGLPAALKIRVAGQSVMASLTPAGEMSGVDRYLVDGFLEEMPYAIPNYRVDYAMRNTQVPVGFWRSVNLSQNIFFRESFIDELAHAAGQDPYQYRRALLGNAPRLLAVLDAAAEKAGWGQGPAKAGARGIAINAAFGSVCAQVVEASVGDGGQVRVHRVVCAMDCGHAVNPLGVKAQVEGAIVEGLSAALHGEIEIADGAVVQSNFHDYPLLRMSEMPQVETILVRGHDGWGGVGETPLPPLAPALCNALFAATGQRVRSLPLAKHGFRRS